MKLILLAIVFALSFIPASAQKDKSTNIDKKPDDKLLLITAGRVTNAHKKEFIELLRQLRTKGEFYTEESEQKAAPYLPVLFALTEKDIDESDIYPFAAISRGICNLSEYRDYAVSHFSEIRHPVLKLFWAAMLFDEKVETSEIVQYLKEALKSKVQAKRLSEIIGPEFDDFKRRVLTNSINN